MKKLATTPSFSEIIQQDSLYVDKTALAKKLIEEGRHYFLSRPHGFGKSLFLDTLKHICQADKELFKGLSIYESDYNWKKHPVLYIDFASFPNANPQEFEQGVIQFLHERGKEYNLSSEGFIGLSLSWLLEEMSEENPVVLLVDNYDKPLTDHIDNPEFLEKNHRVLKEFLCSLKSSDGSLELSFVTGVRRITMASEFSGYNNYYDISYSKKYASLWGYTDEEIDNDFCEYLEAYARQKQLKKEEVKKELSTWCGGYYFSDKGPKVYKPNFVHAFFKGKENTIKFPEDMLEKAVEYREWLYKLGGTHLSCNSLNGMSEPLGIDLRSLMLQLGYLTIYGYDEWTYTLGFPNKFVRHSFFESMLKYFSGEQIPVESRQICQALDTENFSKFVELINEYLSKISSELFSAPLEAFFLNILLFLLELSDIPCKGSKFCSRGRIHLLVERERIITCIEGKLDKSAKEALEEIKEKSSLEPYFNRGKKVVALGLNFDSSEFKISEHSFDIYSEKEQKSFAKPNSKP